MLGLVGREEDDDDEEERGRADGGERLRLLRSVVVGDAVLDAREAARRAAERVTRTVLDDDEELLIGEG